MTTMRDDPAAADTLEAALERNRGRNVRRSLYTPRGGECIEGSLRRARGAKSTINVRFCPPN